MDQLAKPVLEIRPSHKARADDSLLERGAGTPKEAECVAIQCLVVPCGRACRLSARPVVGPPLDIGACEPRCIDRS